MPRLAILDGIRVLSLDIWMTLIRSNPDNRVGRATLIANHLGYSGNISAFIQTIKQVDDFIDQLSEENGVQYGLMDRVLKIRETLIAGEILHCPTHFVHPSIILSDDTIAAIDAGLMELMTAYPPLLIEQDLPSTLAGLKTLGLQLAVISNTGFIDGKYMRLSLDRLGIWKYIDFGVFSNEVGYAKPDVRIFRLLAQQANEDTSAIIHIGDNLTTDYRGAKAAGLKSLHFSPDSEEDSEKITSLRSLLA